MRIVTLFILLWAIENSAFGEGPGETLFKQGLIQLNLGKYENAIEQFEKSFAADPSRSAPLINSAWCYERLAELAKQTGDYKEELRNERLALAQYETVARMKKARVAHIEIVRSRIPLLQQDIKRLEEDRRRENEARRSAVA